MIPVNRLAVWLIASFVALVSLPMSVAGTEPFGNVAVLLPLVLALELLFYFVITMITSPRMGLSAVFGLSVIMIGARAGCTLIGFALSEVVVPGGRDASFLILYVGNLLSLAFQIVTIILVTPHILSALKPGMVDKEMMSKLGLSGFASGSSKSKVPQDHAMPSGGFVQVFSYDELEGVLRKTAGLKGFVLFNNEGLVVWSDLPGVGDIDSLASQMMSLTSQIGRTLEDSGLNRMQKVVSQTKDSTLILHELNANFGLVLVYDNQTKMVEIDAKASVLVKTAREFLQWKYPGLAVA